MRKCVLTHTHTHTYVCVCVCVYIYICMYTYLLTYILTPCSTVLLEKLSGYQLVQKLSAFNGTRLFITAFTSARHLSLSWASSIQSISPHPIPWRYILILSSLLGLGLPSGLFPSRFPIKTLYTPLPTTHTGYKPRPSHSSRFYHTHNIYIYIYIYIYAVAQWLRCYATNRKVAGSIPYGVIGIFHWHKILPNALWPWGWLSL